MAILGPVSAGKSTFFNALMSNTYSDMKRKKTTMLPLHYICQKSDKNESVEDIYNKNKESNEEILKLRESNIFDVSKHFEELIYHIDPIDDFISLPDKNASYSILDMPGLNCGGDTLYYDYIRRVSRDIDIYILVFDINSGLNTTDEITILKLVTEEILKNKNGYVRILINKCDEIQFKNGKIELGDEELNELYERCSETVNKHCEAIKDRITISPLCSSKLYVYRGVKNNISTIDENQLNNLIKTECGKTELKKLDSVKRKRKYISGLLQKSGQSEQSLFDDWMNDTGYSIFKENLDQVISLYPELISYHIDRDLEKLITSHRAEFNYSVLLQHIKTIVKRIMKVMSVEKKYESIFNKYLKTNFDNLNSLIQSVMKSKVLNMKARKDIRKETMENNIDKIRTALQNTNDYNRIINKVYKTKDISVLITSLTNKKNELLMFKFKNNNFNAEIFSELQEYNLIDIKFFTNTVINTLRHDLNYFNKIYSFLNKNAQESYIITLLNNYIDIYINSKKECELSDFENFVNSINVISKNKKIELPRIATFINKFVTETGLSDYIDYWLTLNSSRVNLAKETRYIYFYLSQLIKKYNEEQNNIEDEEDEEDEDNINNDEEDDEDEDKDEDDNKNEEDGSLINEVDNNNELQDENEEDVENENNNNKEHKTNNNQNEDGYEDNLNSYTNCIIGYERFNSVIDKLDLIYETIAKNVARNIVEKENIILKTRYKEEKESQNSLNNRIRNKTKIEETDSDNENSDNDSVLSDFSEVTEDYAESDNSEAVYKKANKNTKKRTRNIIKKKIETEKID